MAEVQFHTELGAAVLVPVEGDTAPALRQAVLRALREYGHLGWRSGTVPPGGFRFPLANEPDFDWRLLGARRGTCTIEGEEREGVWYAGQFYSRRELPATRKIQHPAVKYSRGAKATDPAEIVEEGDGSFRYVTLAVFRGDGRRREEYAVSAAGVASDDQPSAVDPAPASTAATHLPPQDDHDALLLFIRFVGPRVDDGATFVIGRRCENLKQFTRDHWSEIKEQLPVARQVANAMAAAVAEPRSRAA